MLLVAYLLIAAAFGFAISIGAHYTGACMGMPYAAGAIRPVPALLLMAPLALVGAVFASGAVESTVGHGILGSAPVALALALAIVLAAVILTSAYNFLTLPTSTIQILVFSAVGAGLGAGVAIQWATIESLLVLWAIAPFVAFGLGFLLTRAVDRLRPPVATSARPKLLPQYAVLGLVGVGSAASFAMGANDVSNASGAFIMTGLFGLMVAGLVGGVGLALGVLTWGRPLLRTVAFDIVALDARTATISQLSQSAVILVSVGFGFFTSMNQALVGAMIGTGVARRQTTKLRRSVRNILVGWALGPVSGAAVGFLFAVSFHAAGWL